MHSFVFRCPNTKLKVQGWTAEEISAKEISEADAFVPLQCTACTRVHYVNPVTGKVLGMHGQDG